MKFYIFLIKTIDFYLLLCYFLFVANNVCAHEKLHKVMFEDEILWQ